MPAPSAIRRSSSGELQLSCYGDEPASPQGVATAIKRLQVAFPRMEAGFWNLLAERIVANDFTGQRLTDAVNHLIDNFPYRELSVADVIKFDRHAKLYTAHEFMAAQMNGAHPSEFERHEIGGVKYWSKKVDMLNSH